MHITDCCRNCTDRYLACHDHCEIYQTALSEWRRNQQAIKDARSKETSIRSFQVGSVKRMKTSRKTNFKNK